MASLLVLLVACTGGTVERDPKPPTGREDAVRVAVPSGLMLAGPVDRDHPERNRIVGRLLRLIDATPSGARIRIVAHSFSLVPVAERLATAHARGVRVQVITLDRVSGEWQAPAVLREALGTDRSADSFVHLAGGELHEKSWSFSRTAGVPDVTLLGSMNLTYESVQQFNDVIAYRERPDVRRLADRRFAQLLRELPRVRGRAETRLGEDRFTFFPLGGRPDPVAAALATVPPVGARVRVAQHAWLDARGLDLATQLVALDAAGADVEVVLGRGVGPVVRGELESSGVEVHEGDYRDGTEIHHKLTLVSHPRADGGRVRWVLTGSDNYTQRSLDRPELVLRPAVSTAEFVRYQRWMDRLQRRE